MDFILDFIWTVLASIGYTFLFTIWSGKDWKNYFLKVAFLFLLGYGWLNVAVKSGLVPVT